MFSTLRLGLLAVLVASSLSPAAADEKVRVRTLLLSGTYPTGLPSGTIYAVFIDLDYSNRGALTFRAVLAGPDVTMDSDAANFVGDVRGLQLLARDGDSVQGRPGLVHQGMCYICAIGPIPGPRIDAHKGTVFTTLVEAGTAFSGEGLFVSDDLGVVTAVLISGDTAPGNPRFSTLQALGTPVTNPRGDVAFAALLRNDAFATHNAIFAGPPDALRLVVEEDDPVPGLPGFTVAAPYFAQLDTRGRAAFSAWLDDGTGSVATALLSERTGTLEVLLRSGEPFPGEPGLNVTSFTQPALDGKGSVALIAFAPSFQALITDRGGSWETVARLGGSPRNLPNDSFSRLFGAQMNTKGALAFRADLNFAGPAGDDDQVLLVDTPDEQRLVARSGQQAADLPAGIVYDSFTPLAFNDLGQVAFLASLGGPGIVSNSDFALFLTNRRGTPRLIVRAGDSVEVRPGDVRNLARPQPIGGRFRGVSLNDRGQLAFIASFEDQSTAVMEALIRERLARARIR